MTTKSLLHSSLLDNLYYNSMLVGNDAYIPQPTIDNDFEHLQTVVLSSPQSMIYFNNLQTTYGGTYKHLQVRMSTRSNRAGSTNHTAYFQFNGDGGTNYNENVARWDGQGTPTRYGTTPVSGGIVISDGAAAANTAANFWSAAIITIYDPFNSSKYVSTEHQFANPINTYYGPGATELWNGSYMSTAAIQTLMIHCKQSSQYIAGSRFSLYGWRG